MTDSLPQIVDRDAPIFTISVAANLAGMHPQTLRTYDRMGLVRPRRTAGRGRRYSPRDIAALRLVQHLSQVEGVNLNGIRRIIDLQTDLDRMRDQALALREELRRTQVALVEARSLSATGRVFTAESSGAVHLGRRLPRPPLELTGP